jgi:hypothetical protein
MSLRVKSGEYSLMRFSLLVDSPALLFVLDIVLNLCVKSRGYV